MSRLTVKPSNIKNIIIVIMFIVTIFLPASEMIFQFGPKLIINENRTLSTLPELSLKNGLQYPKLFNKYFNDNFGFRKLLIRANASLKLHLLKVSPTPMIILGNNGWSYYNSDAANDGDTVSDFRGETPFSSVQLQKIKDNIEVKSVLLSDKAIPYLVVVAPNKNTIYPEFFPAAFNKVTNVTKLEQVADVMRNSKKLNFIDLRDSLATSKSNFPVYFRNGTHWTEYGAFVAWKEITKKLREYYPSLRIGNEADYTINKITGRDDDSVYEWLGMTDVFYGESISMTEKKTIALSPGIKNPKLHKVIIFCDSFGDSLIKYAKDYFDEVILVKKSKFDRNLIEVESPDVVITEIVERHMYMLLDDDYSGKVNEPAATPQFKKQLPFTRKFRISPSNHSDQNWANGVSKMGDASFFVKNSSEMQKMLTVGQKLQFADGKVRTILSKRVNNDTDLIVYLDGEPLDGMVIGYPKMIEILN